MNPSAQRQWVKPFLNRPILSQKMFVSPCPSHQSRTDRQIDLSRLTILFLPAMFFSCHFLRHNYIPFSVYLYGVPTLGGAGTDIRTVSIISRTVRVQINKLEWSGDWIFQSDYLV
jgi:hypothetical protein